MKERGIIFSAPMVRAILENRKTMTRRVVKPQPPHSCIYTINGNYSHALCLGPNGEFVPPTARSIDHRLPCPYGVPGDRLFVKERAMRAELLDMNAALLKRPSIHMPRWASRITLEITAVRVERLQDINTDDAKAEGLRPIIGCTGTINAWQSPAVDRGRALAVDAFADLWDSINAKRGFGWDANPWVWVVSFRRIKP